MELIDYIGQFIIAAILFFTFSSIPYSFVSKKAKARRAAVSVKDNLLAYSRRNLLASLMFTASLYLMNTFSPDVTQTIGMITFLPIAVLFFSSFGVGRSY